MSQLELRKRLQHLYEAGITSPTQLHNLTGAARGTVYSVIGKLHAGDALEHSKEAGRPPLCDANDRRRLAQLAMSHPRAAAMEIGRMAEARGGPTLSVRTVRNYLHNSGILKLVPKPAPALTAEHKRKRVLFCDAHLRDDFTKTAFSDESSFSFERARLPQWSAGKPRRIPTSKFPKCITVWGAISTMGPSSLALIDGTINQYSYVHTLEEHLLPNMDAFYGADWRFQQDNAPPHVAHSTRAWLAENVPAILDWPANSPDLSSIETLWAIMKNSVEKENIGTAAKFRTQLVQIWNEFDPVMLSRLIESVPVRLRACRDLRGELVILNQL